MNPKYSQIINAFDLNTQFDQKKIESYLRNEVVLVTGGAGSIGKQLSLMLAKCFPKQLVVVDQNEAGLWQLQQEFLEQEFKKTTFLLLDITNSFEVAALFNSYNITTVIHAAAYKQLPLLESNLYQAFKTNYKGTVHVANYAQEHGVKRFLNLSTDKSVLPISILGLTKRAAEIHISNLNREKNANMFYSLRLGNVIGSVGSVMPLFIKQLEQGEKLTLTHLEAERYFVSPKSACELMIQSLFMNLQDSIYVINLKESTKILTLAEQIIACTGKNLATATKDIISVTGLRPGEKLKEELWSHLDRVYATSNVFLSAIKTQQSDSKTYESIHQKLMPIEDPANESVVWENLLNLVPEFDAN